MKIGQIDLNKKILIVAEIGNNHEGNFELAKKMIYLAKETGANAVKFQTFKTEKYVTVKDEKRFKQLKSFEFSAGQFKKLSFIAQKTGLIFLSTPFDLESVDVLVSIVPAFKISSGDNTFWPLIKKVAMSRKPIILSTGLVDDSEIENILDFINSNTEPEFVKNHTALLHCVSSYPATEDNVNLLSIKYLKERFGLTVGYSDHTLGINACLTAVALGARIIEKHFTSDKKLSGFKDHYLSADPKEFRDLVRQIRIIEKSLGAYKKEVLPCEDKLKIIARRSIAASSLIPKGERITLQDLTWVRPATGLKVGQEDLIIGKRVARDIQAGEIIMEADLQ